MSAYERLRAKAAGGQILAHTVIRHHKKHRLILFFNFILGGTDELDVHFSRILRRAGAGAMEELGGELEDHQSSTGACMPSKCRKKAFEKQGQRGDVHGKSVWNRMCVACGSQSARAGILIIRNL